VNIIFPGWENRLLGSKETQTMPRHADPELEQRVLDAAQKLWRGGGDKTLSMRALARAARTNTPAIYRRFKDRENILRALLLRTRQDMYETLKSSQSLEELCENYIDFALRRPREYELYFTHQYEFLRAPRVPGRDEMPVLQWALQKFAGQLGGSPEERVQLALSIWALAHGTATLLIAKATPPERAKELRAACTQAVQDLIQQAKQRGGSNAVNAPSNV
jgi:AcrR family transcriptional regulator